MAGTVKETAANSPVPLLTHPVWADRHPWLVQGTTWRGEGGDFDLGLSGEAGTGVVLGRWRYLQRELGARGMVHSRQVHGTAIQNHGQAFEGILISDGYDGHACSEPGIVLTVSVADCVPVFIIDEQRRTTVLLHAGWRGMAGGIVERGVELILGQGSDPASLRIHFGPAICGRCYEVGPEVHQRLGLHVPGEPTPVDLRSVGVSRAVAAGAEATAITVSGVCTRCHPDRPLFSHRAGERGRQVAVLGIRAGV